MKKTVMKKWIKNTLAIILFIIVCIVLIHFICNRISKIDKIAKQCDKEYGYTCSSYELRNYIIRGN